MRIVKLTAAVVLLGPTGGCETLGDLGGAAMAGAGIAMAGIGIAEGDPGMAEAGSVLAELGVNIAFGDGDMSLDDTWPMGMASAVATETGIPGMFLVAGQTEALPRRPDGAETGSLPGTHDVTGAESNRSQFGGSCQAQEKELLQELETATASGDQSSICNNYRQMRDMAHKYKAFLARCPINDPTGEMSAWADETILTSTQGIHSVCVN